MIVRIRDEDGTEQFRGDAYRLCMALSGTHLYGPVIKQPIWAYTVEVLDDAGNVIASGYVGPPDR